MDSSAARSQALPSRDRGAPVRVRAGLGLGLGLGQLSDASVEVDVQLATLAVAYDESGEEARLS